MFRWGSNRSENVIFAVTPFTLQYWHRESKYNFGHSKLIVLSEVGCDVKGHLHGQSQTPSFFCYCFVGKLIIKQSPFMVIGWNSAFMSSILLKSCNSSKKHQTNFRQYLLSSVIFLLDLCWLYHNIDNKYWPCKTAPKTSRCGVTASSQLPASTLYSYPAFKAVQ
jgi:hypothetical protein